MSGQGTSVDARIDAIVAELGSDLVRKEACQHGANPHDGKISLSRTRICVEATADGQDLKLSDFGGHKEQLMRAVKSKADLAKLKIRN